MSFNFTPLQQVTDDDLRECSRHMKDGDLSVLATCLGIGEREMASIRSRHKTTQGQAHDVLRSWKEMEESSMTTNELSDILKSCNFREASKRYVSNFSIEMYYLFIVLFICWILE